LPSLGGPLGVHRRHRFDGEVVALEERPDQEPVSSVRLDLLRHLRPVGCTAHAGSVGQRGFHIVGTGLALNERKDR
jgi:hypothetical protein